MFGIGGFIMFTPKKTIFKRCCSNRLLFLCLIGSLFLPVFSCSGETSPQKGILGAIFGCAIGDAMGRPTEFKNLQEIFCLYPHGIKGFTDFYDSDFRLDINGKRYAPYTDDTAMAKLVLEQLIKACAYSYDMDVSMGLIAQSFVSDMKNPHGWASRERAPGNACLSGVRELEKRLHDGQTHNCWWNIGSRQSGGCGSVMRAFPFGLMFKDNPEEAERWAVAHSQLTHGAPCALAACAAMAVGTAMSVQHRDPDEVARMMAQVARKYDDATAKMIDDAAALARKNKRGSVALEKTFERSRPVFQRFQGWSAHEAVAAAVYIFVMVPDDIRAALYLGVHTPGDSDSIASMAGSLVGARVGIDAFPKEWIDTIEGALELRALGEKAAALVLCSMPNEK